MEGCNCISRRTAQLQRTLAAQETDTMVEVDRKRWKIQWGWRKRRQQAEDTRSKVEEAFERQLWRGGAGRGGIALGYYTESTDQPDQPKSDKRTLMKKRRAWKLKQRMRRKAQRKG